VRLTAAWYRQHCMAATLPAQQAVPDDVRG
jgi:hypothetical protein